MSGFTSRTRTTVSDRSANKCEVMLPGTCHITAQQHHHRRPRGMGGSKQTPTDSPANDLHVCLRCHAWIESHRELAGRRGWLIPQGSDPTLIPVVYRGDWVLLTGDGGKIMCDTPAGRSKDAADV